MQPARPLPEFPEGPSRIEALLRVAVRWTHQPEGLRVYHEIACSSQGQVLACVAGCSALTAHHRSFRAGLRMDDVP